MTKKPTYQAIFITRVNLDAKNEEEAMAEAVEIAKDTSEQEDINVLQYRLEGPF